MKPDALWAPPITIDDKPVRAGDSATDLKVSVALSTTLLLPNDLNQNAEMSEYENFALMLQHSVQVRLSHLVFFFLYYSILLELLLTFVLSIFLSSDPARPLLLNASF